MKKVLYLLLFIYTFASGQRANFFMEDIAFRLNSVQMDVEGYYWFANDSSVPVNSDIYYPFPNYSNEKIDSIRLYNISAGQNTYYKCDDAHGISFNLFIAPHDTVIFQIGYRQNILGDSATYILRTTQWWGKPLIQAEYKLIVPDSMLIKRFSYLPVKSYKIQGDKIYYWKMDNFMPTFDMIFYF
jgi:hypothetical protein